MTSRSVTVVDYGLGNLWSVARALSAAGANPTVTSSPEDILKAERLVLPGVGSFQDGMKGLTERGLLEPLAAFAESGRPLLGICLGMQIFMTEGTEFGARSGLGLIPGQVTLLDPKGSEGRAPKIPHVGWNGIYADEGRWQGTLLKDFHPGIQFYFVHSFAARTKDRQAVLAECSYGSETFCAAVQKDNVTGFQFHPEKSGPAGLRLLTRFLSQ